MCIFKFLPIGWPNIALRGNPMMVVHQYFIKMTGHTIDPRIAENPSGNWIIDDGSEADIVVYDERKNFYAKEK